MRRSRRVGRAARKLQGTLYEALLRAGSTELSDQDLRADALIVAPHPDDETLGCGGTIARKVAAGAKVTVVFATDGEASHPGLIDPVELATVRRAEALAAAAELGVPSRDVEFLGLPDSRIGTAFEALAAAVEERIERLRPRQVLTVARWEPHHDHGVTAEAVARAVATSPEPPELLEFPIWMFATPPWVPLDPAARASGVRRSLTTGVRLATRFRSHVELGDALDAKRAALQQYVTQTRRYRKDVWWPTLGDVGDGALLERLVGAREVFARAQLPGGTCR